MPKKSRTKAVNEKAVESEAHKNAIKSLRALRVDGNTSALTHFIAIYLEKGCITEKEADKFRR